MDRQPVFLTEKVADSAIESVFSMVFESPGLKSLLKRRTCHVVVAVMNPGGELETLCERSCGDPEQWERRYDEIAQGKFALIATRRHDGRTAPLPHLLYSGDTPYWGGVEYEGLVVTCSGGHAGHPLIAFAVSISRFGDWVLFCTSRRSAFLFTLSKFLECGIFYR